MTNTYILHFKRASFDDKFFPGRSGIIYENKNNEEDEKFIALSLGDEIDHDETERANSDQGYDDPIVD